MNNFGKIGLLVISITILCSVCLLILSDHKVYEDDEVFVIGDPRNENVQQFEDSKEQNNHMDIPLAIAISQIKSSTEISPNMGENAQEYIPVNCEGSRAGISPIIINPTYGEYNSDGEIVYTGDASPTYPYISTPTDPLRSVPLPSATNPVLTKDDVTDYEHVLFVADPFLFPYDDFVWYMFFEVRLSDDHGYDPVSIISYAESHDKGTSWNYMGKVLGDAGGKYAYPYVFKWNNNYYMIPLDGYSNDVTLYKADTFPTTWTAVNRIKTVNDVHDQVVFRWDEVWWLFVREDNGLNAYYSSTLESDEWTPHNGNPIWTHPTRSRPGGRPVIRDNHIVMYYQESVEEYGDKVVAYMITELTMNSFIQTELPDSPILEESGYGWNKDRMHHNDPWYIGEGKGWIVAVDGENNDLSEWSIGMNYIPEQWEGDSITIHAEVDDDESPLDWEIEWNDPNDPGAISSGTTAPFIQFSAVHTYLDEGIFSPILTVTDPSNNLDSYTYTLPLMDRKPTANFIWSPEPQDEGVSVSFTDTSMSSPDTITGWSWDFNGQGFSTDQNPSFTFIDDGVHTVTLTVTDDDGSINSVFHDVLITDLGPQAEFSWLPEPQVEGSPVQFTDESTSYPDIVVTWDWDFGGIGASTEQHPLFAFNNDGVYHIEVTTTDEDGSMDTVSHDVTITDLGPIAEFSWSPDPQEEGMAVQFIDLSYSYPDDIVSWDWNFDGLGTSTDQNPSFTFNVVGTYTVTLTISDEDGSTSIDSALVTIVSKPIEPVTMTIVDGYDEKNQKTFEQLGTTSTVQASDDVRWVTEKRYYSSYVFSDIVFPSGANIDSVLIYVEHYEDRGFKIGNLQWNIGSGWPSSPIVWGSLTAPLHLGQNDEGVDVWDVTGHVDSTMKVNSMELNVQNNDAKKKTKVDHIYAIVQYSTGPPNEPPVADPQSIITAEDTPVSITLTGSDPEGDPLTYTIVSSPSHGSLTGTAPAVAYIPDANYHGDDGFTFKVNDGRTDSNIASVSITVTSINDVPVADPQSLTTEVDNPISITLTGSDLDGDQLTFIIVNQPSNGVISGTAPDITYTPNLGFLGSDSFTFKVNDNTIDSELATISIEVVNDIPTNVMHISSIEMSLVVKNKGKNTFTYAVALVTVVDADGNPVGTATVEGHWSDATSDSDLDITNEFGIVSIDSNQVKNAPIGTTFTFTVDNIILEGWTYDPGKNNETTDSIVT